MNRPHQPGRIPSNLWILLLAAFAILAAAGRHPGAVAQAQWATSGNDINNTNTGNVGIGTNLPGFKLEVNGSASRNTVGITSDGDSVGFAGIRIGAKTTTGIATNRTAAFVLSMRKDSWYGGDGSGPSFIIETTTKSGGFAAPFLITPTNDVILNGGQGASGLAYGNVGVGKTTPAFKLDVGGSINGTGLCIAGDCKTAWSQVTGASQWATSGTSVYYSSGNVGVGTAAPGARLDVGAGAPARGSYSDLLVGAGGDNAQVEFYGATKSSAIAHDETMGGLVFYTNGPAFSPSLFLSNAGNVGVGTTSPATKLDVNGFARVEGAGAGFSVKNTNGWSQMYVTRTASNQAAFIANPSVAQSPTNPYWAMGLSSDGSAGWSLDTWDGSSMTNRVRVTPTGELGIGTTTPASKLTVNVTNNADGITLDGTMNPTFTLKTSGVAKGYFGAATTASAYVAGSSPGDIILRSQGGKLFLDTNSGVGTPAVTVAGANGNVGVGTITPGYKLDVQGGQINTSGGLCIAGDCKTAWSQVGGGTSSQWATSGSNISFSSGSVGIGTASPTQLLDVSGSGEVKARAAGTLSAAIQLQESTGTPTWSEWQQYYDRLRLNMSDGTTTRPDVMTILPNGKVGIGKATPTEALDVVGNINVSGNINAKYQDVAEWVPSTQKLSAGTVVILDPARANHVLASKGAYDTSVAGVVSARPGIALGEAGEDKALVATTGRVRVRVDATRAAIKVGDLLVTSEVEGVAMKSVPVDLGGTRIHRPGTIIGKALEPLEKGTGEILVLLSLQ